MRYIRKLVRHSRGQRRYVAVNLPTGTKKVFGNCVNVVIEETPDGKGVTIRPLVLD